MTAVSITGRDYFTDHSVLFDPYEYLEAIRARDPGGSW